MALIEAAKQASGGNEPKIVKKYWAPAQDLPRVVRLSCGGSQDWDRMQRMSGYIPSIEPYYKSLNELAKLWK